MTDQQMKDIQNYGKADKIVKPFKPGDMWSDDFDYVGMLQWGATATLELGLETLEAGYESFTDVNYHTEAQDLGNAIEWMEDPGQDANRAQEMIEEFQIIID